MNDMHAEALRQAQCLSSMPGCTLSQISVAHPFSWPCKSPGTSKSKTCQKLTCHQRCLLKKSLPSLDRVVGEVEEEGEGDPRRSKKLLGQSLCLCRMKRAQRMRGSGNSQKSPPRRSRRRQRQAHVPELKGRRVGSRSRAAQSQSSSQRSEEKLQTLAPSFAKSKCRKKSKRKNSS